MFPVCREHSSGQAEMLTPVGHLICDQRTFRALRTDEEQFQGPGRRGRVVPGGRRECGRRRRGTARGPQPERKKRGGGGWGGGGGGAGRARARENKGTGGGGERRGGGGGAAAGRGRRPGRPR